VDVFHVCLSISPWEHNLISNLLPQTRASSPPGLLELVCELLVVPNQVPGVDLQLVLPPQVILIQGISVFDGKIALLEFHDELEELLLVIVVDPGTGSLVVFSPSLGPILNVCLNCDIIVTANSLIQWYMLPIFGVWYQ
jgi:hypothetical protein